MAIGGRELKTVIGRRAYSPLRGLLLATLPAIEETMDEQKPHVCRVWLPPMKVFSAPDRQFTPQETNFLSRKYTQKQQRRLVNEHSAAR